MLRDKSMIAKQKENKFYAQLERQFKELASKDKAFVRVPSKEEILKHIDVDSDPYIARDNS